MRNVVLVLILCTITVRAQFVDILSWSTRAPAPSPGRCQIQGHGNIRDTIYICGGRTSSAIGVRTVYAYVPITDTWITSLPPMPGPRSHGCGDVIGADLYAAGGFDSSGTTQRTLYHFNADTKLWDTLASMPAAIILGAGAAYGARFYVFGSQNRGDTLYEYNPGMDSWTPRIPATRPLGRRAATAAGTTNYLYVMGGIGMGDTALSDCWRFQRPGGGSWTRLADMPGKRCMHIAYAVVGDSIIYVVGGNPTSMGSACDAIVYKYTITSDTWTTDIPMLTARGFLTLDRATDKIYAICGINGGTYFTTNEEGAFMVGIVENSHAENQINLTVRPNPMRDVLKISYNVDSRTHVSVNIYNSYGMLVKVFADKTEEPGTKTIVLDRTVLNSGVYFIQIKTDSTSKTCKMVLL